MGCRRRYFGRWTLSEGRRLSVWIFAASFFLTVTLSPVQAKLIFTDRLHEARVYHGAPAGLYVTTVRASHDASNNVTASEANHTVSSWPSSPPQSITYKLLRGGGEFHVDDKSGRVSTRVKVAKQVGESYALLVVAVSGGETESLHEEVRVTRYNRFTPWFTRASYRLEIPRNEPVGTNVMRVEAKDDDKDSYNAEVYYYLRPKGIMGGDIGPHANANGTQSSGAADDVDDDDSNGDDDVSMESNVRWSDYSRYFDIGPRDGNLALRHSLGTKVATLFVFDVVAIDGGSPLRWNVTTLEVVVKNITEPLDIKANNVTVTSARVCWKKPSHGLIRGYLVRYKEVWRNEASNSYNRTPPVRREDVLNITVEHNIADHHCVHLRNLHPNSKFELSAYGWNVDEIGLASKLFSFTTSKPSCPVENVCGDNGKCHILNDYDYSNPSPTPNYTCDCDAGFYGVHCEIFDPCSSSPCHNLGRCTNVSNFVYECECVDGFYGSDCSRFNPCASVDVVACHNGGICRSSGSHMYECLCRDGFFGRGCERFDPCKAVSPPCLNGASCQNVSDSVVSCSCLSGFRGKRCEEDIDECASSPCLNSGTCEDGVHSFSCLCSSGFKGALCQEEVDECESYPCLNGGSCEDRVNEFECVCLPGYEGNRCEVDVDDCLPNPCLNGAICRDGPNSYTCLCAFGYEGALCKDSMTCLPESLNLTKGDLFFNATPHGNVVELPCPYGPSGAFVLRRCILIEGGTVEWTAPDLTLCRDEGFRMAESLTGHLRLLTSNPAMLSASKLSEVATKLEIVLQYAFKDTEIAKEMVDVISNVLDANETVFTARNDNSTATRFFNVLERFVNNVEMPNQNMVLEADNLRISISKLKPSGSGGVPSNSFQLKGITSKVGSSPNVDQSEDHVNGTDHVYSKDADDGSIINISPDIVRLVPKGNEMRLQFVAFRNAKIFKEHSALPFDRYTPADHPVFSLSVANLTVRNMSEVVKFTVKKPLYGTWTCVYWDDTGMGRWSKHGLTIQQSEDEITCSSNHLTAFSVLLDPDPQLMDAAHQMSLSIISYVGSGLSVIGLSLTIITYSLFRCLNRDKPGKILLNLCISMLLMNVAFLAGSLEPKAGQPQIFDFNSSIPMSKASNLCRLVAVFTHYFLLTTLSWMTVEAANMYQLLIHVFATSETKFMVKRCIVAWGFPLVIVGTTATVNMTYYDARNEYCMLSPAHPYVYYVTYFGPSCLLLLVNVIVFIFVSRVLFQPRGMPPRMQHKPGGRSHVTITFAQVRGSFTVMILLGITWVFGALAIGPARVLFQYVFCVLNSLQGFLVFVVRCLQYPEARSAWYVFLKTGTLKKHRGTRMTTSTNSHVKLSLSGGGGGGGGVGGGSGFNGSSSAVGNLRDGRKNSNLSVNASSDGTITTFASSVNRSAPSWVYGGRLPQNVVTGGDVSVKVVIADDSSVIKNRSARQLPSNRGIITSGIETLDTKEGRDTHWQYLNLNGKYAGSRDQRAIGCWVPDTEPVQLSTDDTYDLPFMEDEAEDLEMHDDTICENVSIKKFGAKSCTKPKNGSQCDQGYSSAEQSPSSKRVTAGLLARRGSGFVDTLTSSEASSSK